MASGKLDPMMEGIKEGAVKQTIDEFVNSIIGPSIENLKENLGLEEGETKAEILELMVKFTLMMGLSKGVEVFGEQAFSLIGSEEDAAERARLISEFMAKYAGEKVGEEGVKAVMGNLPALLTGLNSIKTEDLRMLESSKSEKNKVPTSSLLDQVEEETVSAVPKQEKE